tara:strand:+ start:100 stop:582 length:483 start_codon:yes stop_codon:yes gene_type:complete
LIAPALLKKLAQQIRTFCFVQTLYPLHTMVQCRVIKYRTGAKDGPGSGLPSGKYEAPDSSVNQCAATHRAGFQRHIEGCAWQPVITVPDARFSQYPDFGMGRGIVKLYLSVTAMSQHDFIACQYCTYRHFTTIRRAPGFFEGQGHAALIPFTETHSGASL